MGKNFVDQKLLLAEIIIYQQKYREMQEHNLLHDDKLPMPKMSDVIGRMVLEMSRKFSNLPSFNRYYNDLDDMRQEAALTVVHAIRKYDTTRNTSPFAFLTECIKNTFFAYLKKKYKDSNFRLKMIEEEFIKHNRPFVNEIEKDMRANQEEREKKHVFSD